MRRRVYQAPMWQFFLTMALVVLEIAEINQFLPEVNSWPPSIFHFQKIHFFVSMCSILSCPCFKVWLALTF